MHGLAKFFSNNRRMHKKFIEASKVFTIEKTKRKLFTGRSDGKRRNTNVDDAALPFKSKTTVLWMLTVRGVHL